MPVVTRPSPQLRGRYLDASYRSKGSKLGPGAPELPLANKVLHGAKDLYEGDLRKPSDNALRPALLCSSFRDWKEDASIVSYKNGFVDGINDAFAKDLDLVLRPDDVWLAILTQFSLFVVGHAEEVRHLFVEHKYKKSLSVDLSPFSLSQLDLGRLAQEMTSVIQENVVDPDLKKWMIPTFSTTTDHDASVASFVMMGAMQKYFEYSFVVGCGFPSVTLLGEKSDWEDIETRIKELPKYGKEPDEWSKLLLVTIRYMVKTFDEPDSPDIKNFWLRVSHEEGPYASGTRTLSGWITAFCFWDEEGQRVYDYPDSAFSRGWGSSLEARKRLTLDDVSFPLIHYSNVPRGVVSLPITIVDGDARVNRVCTAYAGSVGMKLSDSDARVQPLPGWFVVQEWEEPLHLLAKKTGSTTAGSVGSESREQGSTTDEIFDENALV